MPVPFGVSVGDFIAAIELIHTIVQALEESTGAGAHYRGVILSMKNLERALSSLKSIESDDVVQKAAMLEIATYCSDSIQRFFGKVQKYQPALQLNGRNKKWKDALRKVQWTLLEKQEVRDFQAEIESHIMSLHILLVQLQLTNTTAAHRDTRQSLIRVDQRIDEQNALQLMVLAALSQCAVEVRGILHAVLIGNFSIFNLFATLQSFLNTVPPQVLFDQPVIFQDAHGQRYPIHTQTICSWRAFECVLVDKFGSQPGVSMIESGKYDLSDAGSSSVTNRQQPFERVFRSGHSINMSMVFETHGNIQSVCPACGNENNETVGNYVSCICGLNYSRKENRLSVETQSAELESPHPAELIQSGDLSPLQLLSHHDYPGEFVRVILDPVVHDVIQCPSDASSVGAEFISVVRCERCSYVYSNHSNRRKHILTHLKPHMCPHESCNRHITGFATPNDLDRHLKVIHKSGLDVWWKCEYPGCNKTSRLHFFGRKDNFITHITRRHRELGTSDIKELINRSLHTPTPAEIHAAGRARKPRLDPRGRRD